MSALVQVALWGLASAVPVVLAYLTHKMAALGLATMLLLGWCLGRVLGALYTLPESVGLYPLIDAAFGLLAFASWRQERAPWKLVLVSLFVFQCAGHAAFWLAYPGGLSTGKSAEIVYRYLASNNVLYGLELLTVAWAGGVGDLARRVFSSLPRGAGPRHHAGAGGG